MRNLFLILGLGCALAAWAQDSSSKPAPAQDSGHPVSQQQTKPRTPDLSGPRSDRVNADALEAGESSSKDEQVDLSPPADDAKAHPNSSESLDSATVPSGDTTEFHPWDPHKSAKDVEVGDFYFKRKNYKAAEDRYREALYYKDNDALAAYRLAVCLEKLNRPEDAVLEYQSYLKILPHGPEAEESRKAIERLKQTLSKSPAN